MEEFIIIVVSLLFSGFFSGMEIAFVSANKLRVELMQQKGWISGKLLSSFVQNPSRFLGTCLVGNNIALVVYGMMMAKVLEPPIQEFLPAHLQYQLNIILLQTFISTFIVLITGEFLPKVVFRINPSLILSLFTLPFRIIYYLLSPLVLSTVWLSKIVLRVFFRKSLPKNRSVFGKVDLDYILEESDKSTLQQEANIDPKIFQKALYLREVKVRECMVPRTEVVGVDVNSDIEELEKTFIETKLSKIIIFNNSIDNIIGYVHHFAMLQEPKNIQSIVMSIPLVPETMTAIEVLDLLIKQQKTIAWVVDEFGGTDGIVTLEDIIEEIFGEIDDEYDVEELIERVVAKNTYIFSARLEVDYLNEAYHLDIPTGEYETLAGFIIDHYESIPADGENITINNFDITILKSSQNKINTVKFQKLEPEETKEEI